MSDDVTIFPVPRSRAIATPAEIVQRQLDAYNARDLDRFVATYADTIRIFRMPSATPFISGKGELGKHYGTRFSHTLLHAELVNRIELGDKIIDHERVSGLKEFPFDAVVVYQVAAELIQTVWLFAPEP